MTFVWVQVSPLVIVILNNSNLVLGETMTAGMMVSAGSGRSWSGVSSVRVQTRDRSLAFFFSVSVLVWVRNQGGILVSV